MFIVTVNEERCKGCGLCTTVCPKKIMELDGKKLSAKGYHPAYCTDRDKCIGCRSCAIMCPDVAIKIEKN